MFHMTSLQAKLADARAIQVPVLYDCPGPIPGIEPSKVEPAELEPAIANQAGQGGTASQSIELQNLPRATQIERLTVAAGFAAIDPAKPHHVGIVQEHLGTYTRHIYATGPLLPAGD
ncbi:hypothetical protein N7490_010102 [Penicillium lividum]|nr:hypothetical protein N7490_010102 [Penicillium lividum]